MLTDFWERQRSEGSEEPSTARAGTGVRSGSSLLFTQWDSNLFPKVWSSEPGPGWRQRATTDPLTQNLHFNGTPRH